MIYTFATAPGVPPNQFTSILSPGETGTGGSESATSDGSITVIRFPFFRSSAVAPDGAFAISVETCRNCHGRFFVGVNRTVAVPSARTVVEN